MNQWLRVLAAGVFVLSTAACSWIETVPSTSVDGGGSTVGGGSGGGGGSVVPDVVVYTALWEPSPSAGVAGYRLHIDDLRGGTHREVQIPISAATAVPTGLAYGVNLETDADYILTLQAYDGDSVSQLSNAIVVYGDSLIASAASAATASAAHATAPYATAPSAATAASNAVASSSPATSTTSQTEAGATSADPDSNGAATALEQEQEQALADGASLSVDLDGQGAYLEGMADLNIGADALTLSTWVRPAAAGDGRRTLAAVRDAAGNDRLEVSIVDGVDVAVTLLDGTGDLLASVEFAAALELDVWQHLALVVDPAADSVLTLYVASSAVPASSATVNASGALLDLVGLVRLGDAGGAGYVGGLGHTAIFSGALDVTQIERIDTDGHAIDLRSGLDAGTASLAHYWRIGEGDLEEPDLGESEWPVDLSASMDGLYVIEDAPQPL